MDIMYKMDIVRFLFDSNWYFLKELVTLIVNITLIKLIEPV